MLIATRELTYVGEAGPVSVPVRIFAPEGSNYHWWCRYEIGWPTGLEARAGYGYDQIQALYLTLQKIGASLYLSDYHKTGQLYWEKLGSGYGFPVPKNARDLLVGDDKRFEG